MYRNYRSQGIYLDGLARALENSPNRQWFRRSVRRHGNRRRAALAAFDRGWRVDRRGRLRQPR